MVKNSKTLEKELAELEARQKADAARKKELNTLIAARKKEEARERQAKFGAAFESACKTLGKSVEVNEAIAKEAAKLFFEKYPSGKYAGTTETQQGDTYV